MTIKVAFMAMRKASQHPWKERGNAEGMLYSTVQCRVMNAILTLGQTKAEKLIPSNLYPVRIQASYRRATDGLNFPTGLCVGFSIGQF